MHELLDLYRAYVIILMREYTQTELAHTDSESAQHFLTRKNYVFLVLLTGFELGSWNMKSVRPLPFEPPRHPSNYNKHKLYESESE